MIGLDIHTLKASALAGLAIEKASISSMLCLCGGQNVADRIGATGGPKLEKALRATWALARIGICHPMSPVQALDVAREFMVTMGDYRYQV